MEVVQNYPQKQVFQRKMPEFAPNFFHYCSAFSISNSKQWAALKTQQSFFNEPKIFQKESFEICKKKQAACSNKQKQNLTIWLELKLEKKC